MLASSLLLAALSCAPGQFGEPDFVLPPSISIRPDNDDVLPRGGLFIATINNDATNAYSVTRARYGAPGDEAEDLQVFPSCITFGDNCIFRSRFPFDGPADREVLIEARADSDAVTDFSAVVTVGEPDLSPPTGMDSARIQVSQEAPGFGETEWHTTLIVSAPELDDRESSIGLLEVYETTEDDNALLAHAVPDASWTSADMVLYVPVDVPESTSRCYRLVATDLGGNEASSDDICFDLVLDEGVGRACSQGGPPPSLLALLGLLALRPARRRRRRTC
jgi:hypothetical protein